MTALVSICIASYNHERYVHECVESALSQTLNDIEIIIVDDCSTDSTVDEIKKFNDSRIRLYVNDSNVGLSRTLNRAISHAEGKYISLSGSDDVFYPERLEKQVEFLHQHKSVAAVFSDVSYIDAASKPLESPNGADQVSQANQSRQMWLSEFFEGKNRLPAPTATFEKALIEKIGGFDPRLIQTQDLDLWIRIALKFDIEKISSKLMHYRIHENNLSAGSSGKKARLYWELSRTLNNYRTIYDKRFMEEIFPFEKDLKEDGVSCEICLAVYASNHSLVFVRNFGLRILFDLLADPTCSTTLEKLGYGYRYLYDKSRYAGVFSENSDQWALDQAANWRKAYDCLYAEHMIQARRIDDLETERNILKQQNS